MGNSSHTPTLKKRFVAKCFEMLAFFVFFKRFGNKWRKAIFIVLFLLHVATFNERALAKLKKAELTSDL